MTTNWHFIFGVALLESFVLSLVLTPFFRLMAIRLGVLDFPGERKLQSQPVPLLGGAAIVAAFGLTILTNAILLHYSGALGFDWIEEHVLLFFGGDALYKLLGLSLGGIAIFALGVLDDLQALTPERKLAGQIAASALPVAFGIRVDFFIDAILLRFVENPHAIEPIVPWISGVLSIVWLVTIINAMNFIDNMDGLCAGISGIAAMSFFFCVAPQGEYFTAVTLLVFAGSALGFLYYNLPPARLFMGDAGAMFCGYVLGALALVGTFYTEASGTRVAIMAPLIALTVPLFDMVSVVWLRIRKGESIMKGDKLHFSHRLVEAGMGQRQAVEFIYVIAALTGLSGALLLHVGTLGAVVIVAQTVGLFGLVIVLMRVRRPGQD